MMRLVKDDYVPSRRPEQPLDSTWLFERINRGDDQGCVSQDAVP